MTNNLIDQIGNTLKDSWKNSSKPLRVIYSISIVSLALGIGYNILNTVKIIKMDQELERNHEYIARLNQQKEKVSQQEYDQAYQKVLGDGGLADTNGDGEVDSYEFGDACRKMGVEYDIEIRYNPREPITENQLERYINRNTTQTPTESLQ